MRVIIPQSRWACPLADPDRYEVVIRLAVRPDAFDHRICPAAAGRTVPAGLPA